MEDLDKIDFQILRLLQENSNITNLSLSKKIGLSPAPTLERVKKLEKNGVIRSYHAEVDPLSLGPDGEDLYPGQHRMA
jgi:DNA-binding Lrp family transcriptional regulator